MDTLLTPYPRLFPPATPRPPAPEPSKQLCARPLLEGVARNFGSSDPAATQQVAGQFVAACFPGMDTDTTATESSDSPSPALLLPPTLELVRANLRDQSCRHLLLFAQPASVAVPLLAASGVSAVADAEVIWGTDFPGGKVRA